jgi:hypothetical protein
MKPDKLTIHDLFQRERRYVVPLYQRAYVWNREEQWEPLWDDIERQAEECLKAENFVSKRSHFLGAIVLNVSRIIGAGVARSEIIDGQQRLTTLQILIAVIRDYAAQTSSAHVSRLHCLTVNEHEKAGSDDSFKVWPTNADRETFRSVMSAGSPEALLRSLGKDTSNAPRMAAAYMYFYDRVREFVSVAGDDNDGREQRLFGLLQALRTALQVVVIELEDGDDPQVIFETLNARGQPLLPSDLIRNYIFLQAANDPSSNADYLYNGYWRSFDDIRVKTPINGEDRFWHIEERQGRLTRPRIDLFLFHYLVMQTERDLNIGQLFREFRDWRDDHPGPIENLLGDLKRFSEIFARLAQPDGDDRAAIIARRLKALDNSTVYPLLLYILSLPSDRLSLASRDQILDDLESWLVRRFICQLTNKNYNRFFVSLLAKVKRAPTNANLADIVRGELSRSSDVTTAWPTDQQFRESWLSKPLYMKSRPDRSAMILGAIEAHIRTRRNEAVKLPVSLTIEHLLPQKGSLSDYPFDDAMPLLAGENSDRCRERMLHTVGNLTLLTSELNASVSNGPFPAKVAKIISDSDLRLNAWLRCDAPTAWSEQSIITRGENLFESVVEIWRGPTVEPEFVEEEDEGSAKRKGVWRFTEAAQLRAKREDAVAALSAREAVVLRAETVAKYGSADGLVRAVVAVSKRYVDRGAILYWYAYHPEWDAFLADGKKGFFLLGCMDRNKAYAVPRSVIEPHLSEVNTTVRARTGKLHWHIQLVERGGELAMLLPKRDDALSIEPYAIDLPQKKDSPIVQSDTVF